VSEFPKTGLDALLTPEESVLVLIDHQPFQFANLHSHEPMMIVNNAIGLARTAKAYGVPTILTTVVEERGGLIIQGLQDVFPTRSRSTGRPSTAGRTSAWWTPSRRPGARS
jgi:nicotinamidase-related amidase